MSRRTHVLAGAVQIVPTVHGDVQRMHLRPAVRRARLGEVTWRAGGRDQNARLPSAARRPDNSETRFLVVISPLFPPSVPATAGTR